MYATLNGYRFDDFSTYIYMSDNYGQTWTNIGSALPTSPVNVIKEDPENENILYVGTDNGAYVSFNRGASWEAFSNNLPNVAVHDLVVQPTAKHLILGTHGRSLYKANIAPLQEMNSETLAKSVHLFSVNNIYKSRSWGSSWSQWRAPNLPKLTIPLYANSNKNITVKIYTDDVLINSFSKNVDKGYSELTYDVSMSKKGKKAFEKATKNNINKAKNGVYYLPKGMYTVKVEDESTTFKVK